MAVRRAVNTQRGSQKTDGTDFDQNVLVFISSSSSIIVLFFFLAAFFFFRSLMMLLLKDIWDVVCLYRVVHQLIRRR